MLKKQSIESLENVQNLANCDNKVSNKQFITLFEVNVEKTVN